MSSTSEIAAAIDEQIRISQRIQLSLQNRLKWALLLKDTALLSLNSSAENALRLVEANSDLIFNNPLPVPPRPRPPHSRFLYIFHDDQYYLLRCPRCFRTTFTTLQGLLNHARIVHRLEWGTHEDCVLECAVPQSDLDTSSGVEVPSSILPRLQSIFQMAVSSQRAANHTARTLGLHKDSPTLAPFLGKSPIRRAINFHEQDDPLDIVNVEENVPRSRRLPLPQRNEASQHLHNIGEQSYLNPEPSNRGIQPGLDLARSRFYFTTRIVVIDRSLWVPPSRRQEGYESHSHKWMVSIHSPSYAYDLSTILRSMTVAPANESAPYVHSYSGTPPFVVVGTSDRPFLARIELRFNGIGPTELTSTISETQKVVLEHWIELDPVKSGVPVSGEEQITDIELDKRTIFGSAPHNPAAFDPKAAWDVVPAPLVSKMDVEEEQRLNYSRVLDRLATAYAKSSATNYPTTLAESKASRQRPFRTQPQLSMGRRKAIEWRRAKTLQGSYLEETSGNQLNLPNLSVGDVYAWLSSNGHFHRPSVTGLHWAKPLEVEDTSSSSHHCHICGLDRATCSTSILQNDTPSNGLHPCRSAHKLSGFPLVDVADIKTMVSLPPSSVSISHFSARDLVQASNPRVVEVVKSFVEPLAIPAFCTGQQLDNMERTIIESKLGSYALLSLLIQSLVRSLVLGGIDVSRRDRDLALSTQKIWRGGQARPKVILTPSHIVSAIAARSRYDPLFGCIAGVGLTEVSGR